MAGSQSNLEGKTLIELLADYEEQNKIIRENSEILEEGEADNETLKQVTKEFLAAAKERDAILATMITKIFARS